MNVEAELLALLDSLASCRLSHHEEAMASVIASCREDAVHGEWGLALEEVCAYLYEYDFPLSAEDLARIESLAARMSIDRSCVEPLYELLT